MDFVNLIVDVFVDANGNAVAIGGAEGAPSGTSVKELWESDIGDFDSVTTRHVQLTVRVPLPRPVPVAVTVPDLPNSATLVQAAMGR